MTTPDKINHYQQRYDALMRALGSVNPLIVGSEEHDDAMDDVWDLFDEFNGNRI